MSDEQVPYSLGALPSPPEVVAKAWPITLLVAQPPTLDPRPSFHSPRCPKTVDQDGVGACVAFSGFYVQSGQEVADEGHLLTTGNIDPMATYYRVKAENGDPNDTSPGLYPPQLWDSVKARGWVAKDGITRPISGYYLAGHPSSDLGFLALMQAAIDQLGPLQLTSGWDANWFLTDANGFLKAPLDQTRGGHAYAACGWGTFAGLVFPLCHQTWGAWGHNPYPDHFYIDPRFWEHPSVAPTEAWHVTDKTDAPSPGGSDVVPAKDATPRLLSIPVGTQLYSPDTNAPLVKLGGTAPAKVVSAGAVNDTQYLVRISTGGVPQWLRVAKSAVTVISSSPIS